MKAHLLVALLIVCILPSIASPQTAEEIIERNANIYRSRLPNARVRVIPRVGYDVHASCGMFFAPEGPLQEQVAIDPCRLSDGAGE